MTTIAETAFSGAVSGVVGVTGYYPFDVIRCRQQANITSRMSMFRTAKTMVQNNGTRVLFKGMCAQLFWNVPAQGTYFTVYEKSKEYIKPHVRPGSALVEGLAGALATTAGFAFWTPMDTICQRCQATDNFHNTGRNIFSKIWAREGIRGLYAGFFPSLLVEIPMVSAFWIIYERLKRPLRPYLRSEEMTVASSSAIAAIIATWITNPVDIIRTHIQLSGPGGPKELRRAKAERTGFRVASEILRQHGVCRLFRVGVLARCFVSVPDFVLGVSVFECVKRWMMEGDLTLNEDLDGEPASTPAAYAL